MTALLSTGIRVGRISLSSVKNFERLRSAGQALSRFVLVWLRGMCGLHGSYTIQRMQGL